MINSRETEVSILGSIMVDDSILPRVVSYLQPEDFFYGDTRKVYHAMINLYSNGVEINVKTVWNELYKQNFEDLTETELREWLDYRVGGDTVMSFVTQIAEFSGYRLLEEEVTRLTQDVGERKYSLTDYAGRLTHIATNINAKGLKQDIVTGPALIEEYLAMVGRPKGMYAFTGLPNVDDEFYDFNGKEISYLAARPGTGKALPLSTGILTPRGWVKNQDLKPGDFVIGSDGVGHKVLGVYPQGEREAYRVCFSDGTFVTCDLEHLWETSTRNERRKGLSSVKTTEEILNSLRVNKDNRANHSIKFVSPVEFSSQEVPIDPYLLGLYLGDGNYQQNVRIYSEDEEIINTLKSSGYKGSVFQDRKEGSLYGYRFSTPFSQELAGLGLENLKSYEKFIPKNYLFNSIDVRQALLQGLLDTDGYVNKSHIEYSTTSEVLAHNVQELVRSLGGKSRIAVRSGYYVVNDERIYTRDNYRVFISFPDNGIIPFRLSRKLERFEYISRFSHKFIVDVKKLSSSTQMQCIAVSSPDNLFITEGYNLTHNTAMLLQSARKNLEKGIRVGFLSMEMERAKIINRMLASRAKTEGSQILRMSQDEFLQDRRLTAALDWFATQPLFIDDSGPWNNVTVPQKIRKLVYEHGCQVIYVDYIGLIGAIGHLASANRTLQLADISRSFKELATELNIPILIASQLNREVAKRTDGRPTLADLRDSGALEQDASIVAFLYHDLTSFLGVDLEGEDLDEYFKEKDTIEVKFEVQKQRNGPTFLRNLVFEKPIGIFNEKTRHNATYDTN